MAFLKILFIFITFFQLYSFAINNNLIVKKIPSNSGTVKLTTTLTVTGTVDFQFKEYELTQPCLGQIESQMTVLKVKNNGHVKNLILGANAGNGIVCEGNCTLENVHWRDVCEVG